MEDLIFRTQWMNPFLVALNSFEPSITQPGMSPSISQMVKTRSVGGDLDEYEMNGIDSDAPFDTEYPDRFDVLDQIAEMERGISEDNPSKSDASSKSDVNDASDAGDNEASQS